jgi:ABC-type nitrate/sulfonate/bicarbonate transport system substrate-binding protein
MVMPETPSPRPEADLLVGFTAELACAPLVVAAELGLWSRRGVSVQLRRELGVAGLRDRLLDGSLPAAQVPCGLPLALLAASVPSPEPPPLVAGLILSHGGLALVLSEAIWPSEIPMAGISGYLLRSGRKRVVTLGVASRHSAQAALIQEWMPKAGLSPEQVQLAVIPPAQLDAHLLAGNIDGFCAGALAVSGSMMRGHGRIGASSLPRSAPTDSLPPDTVLALRSIWAHRFPRHYQSVLSGLMEACQFCDKPVHRLQVSQWLSQRHYLNVPVAQILRAWNPLTGSGEAQEAPHETSGGASIVFHQEEAPRPTAAQGRWVFDHALDTEERSLLPASALDAVFQTNLGDLPTHRTSRSMLPAAAGGAHKAQPQKTRGADATHPSQFCVTPRK